MIYVYLSFLFMKKYFQVFSQNHGAFVIYSNITLIYISTLLIYFCSWARDTKQSTTTIVISTPGGGTVGVINSYLPLEKEQ